MPGNDSAPPPEDTNPGNEAEEAAWEIATGETLRARGDLAEAAMWYRRAAQHLMEAGEDERAIEVAKLAAELAALDDAGRPAQVRTPVAESPFARHSVPPAADGASPRPPAPRSKEHLPGPATVPRPAQQPGAPKAPARAPSAVKFEEPTVPTRSVPPPRPPTPAVRARTLPGESGRSRERSSRTGLGRRADGAGVPTGPAQNGTRAAAATSARAGTTPTYEKTDVTTRVIFEDTTRVLLPDAVSPLAAMLDEAVEDIDEAPSVPLQTGSAPAGARRPLSYMPERMLEADQIAARLPALPLFAELPADRVREVAKQVGIVRYRPGDMLCEAGAPEGPMFVIVEGGALVGFPGDESPAAAVTIGDFVGEVAALYGGARSASVVARAGLQAIAFAPSLVRALAREFAAFREAIEEVVRERVGESLPRIAPLLRRLPMGDRLEVFRQFELVTLPEGALLLGEGEVAEAMYLTAAGEVELYGGEFGAARPQYARVGDAFGFTAVVTGEPSGVSARATRAVILARLSRARFQDVAAQFPLLLSAVAEAGMPASGILC